MNALLDMAFSRPRTVIVGLVAILIAGAMSYASIPKEAEPDVSFPTIYVSMTHLGISPEDAVRLLVKPMEKELRTLEGLKEMKSEGAESYATVQLEFEAGFDPDKAMDEVRARVDRARAELPDDTDEPRIQAVNIALLPMMVVNLSGDVSERTLVVLARDLKDRLESLSNVLEAEVAGDRDEIVEINVDPVRLDTYGLSLEEVLNAVQRNNLLVPAGTLTTGSGRFAIKVPGIIDDPEKLLGLAIKRSGDTVVTVADVASVRRTFADPEGFARLDGQPTVALEISKRLGANIIETSQAVRDVTAQIQQAWPQAVKVTYSQDKSDEVKSNLTDLQNNVFSGVLLVMIVIVGILGLRAGSLVGISIPGSFLLGIMVIAALGLTLNIVVLFGLILALGLLVDSTIIVVELADRYQAEGQNRASAYKHAAQRMAWPVISSTLTTLAAFIPLLFWPGVIGEFMRFLPITLICVLSASLLMALVFIPNLGGVIGGTPPDGGEKAWQPGEPLVGWTGRYVGLLQRLLPHSGKVLVFAIGVLVVTFASYTVVGNGVEFFPDVAPEQAVVKIRGRGALSAYEADRLVGGVEAKLQNIKGIDSIYSRSSLNFGRRNDNDIIGQIQLQLENWRTRPPTDQILDEVRARIANTPGIQAEVQKPQAGPRQGKPVAVEIYGRSLTDLKQAVVFLRKGMRAVGGFVDITDSLPNPGLEWRLDVNRTDAARYGADVATIGQAVQLVTQGIKVGEYRAADAEDELDIRVRYADGYRDLGALSRLRINTDGGMVPISNFVTRVPAQKVQNINRIDANRAITVESDVAHGLVVATEIAKLKVWVNNNLGAAKLAPTLQVNFKGEDEDIRKAETFLSNAFMVALALIALVLLTQFNSFYQSFLILSAILFSTIGVLIGLMVTGRPFGVVMSGIGVIALAGIVVNNNIVLIDTYNVLRQEGKNVMDAVIQTGAERMRPVILTTVTTVLGLLPMVIKMNVNLFARDVSFGAPSTQYWAQLATAIVGGLIFATLLTLVLTPCMLVLGERLQARLHGRRLKPATQDL